VWARGIRRGPARGLSGEHAHAALQPQRDAESLFQFLLQFLLQLVVQPVQAEQRVVRRLAEHPVLVEFEWQQRQRVPVPAPAIGLLEQWQRVAVPAGAVQ
jgi:hypothetical protein